MKTVVKVSISAVIIIFGLALAGSSISSLTTPNPKVEQLNKELDTASSYMVDVCMDAKSVSDLTSCKQTIQEIKDSCKDSTHSSFKVCNDPRLDQFFINVDDKISESQNIIDKAKQKVDDASLSLVTLCYVSNDPSCKVSMLDIKRSCIDPLSSSMSVCNDPRVDEILARTQPSTTASDIFESTSQKMITFFDGCMINDDEKSKKDCSETAKQMISLCANTSVNACNDPRLEEIANWYSNQNIEQQIEPPKLNRECQPGRLCVKPGDYLQYSFESPSYMEGKGVLTYYFKDYLDDDNISVQLVYVSDEGNRHEKIRTMNLITGLLNEEAQGGDISVSSNTIPYALDKISPVNLSYENLPNVEITEKKFPGWYGGSYDRDTVFFNSKDAGDFSVSVFVDKETRVIILSQHYIYGGYLVKNDVLKDTNIIPK